MTDSGAASHLRSAPVPGIVAGGGRDEAESGTAARAWPEALEALAGYVAHDLRNALNAVAVNLEVARSRSARGAEAAVVAPFAATAASQFEGVAGAVEALVAFARPEPIPADVAAIVARLARLLSLKEGRSVAVADGARGRALTVAPSDVVRAAVARSVLSALSAGGAIACEISVGDDIFLRVTSATHISPPDSDLVATASAHGVRIASRERAVELRFPAVDPSDTPHGSA